MPPYRKILLLTSIAGGFLYGVLFFVLYGAEHGYSLLLAGTTAISSLFFALSFYFIWILTDRSPKSPFDRFPKYKKKLLAYEEKSELSPEDRIESITLMGNGIFTEYCHAHLYFRPWHIHGAICHRGKLHLMDIPYRDIQKVRFSTNTVVLQLNGDDPQGLQWEIILRSDEATSRLRREFYQRKLPVVESTLMHIEEILCHDEDAMEADVVVSDGEHRLLCYAHPFTPTQGFALFAHMSDPIMGAQSGDYSIEKTSDSHYSYRLQGVLIDRDTPLLRIGGLVIELDGKISGDIEQWDMIECTVERIDLQCL